MKAKTAQNMQKLQNILHEVEKALQTVSFTVHEREPLSPGEPYFFNTMARFRFFGQWRIVQLQETEDRFNLLHDDHLHRLITGIVHEINYYRPGRSETFPPRPS